MQTKVSIIVPIYNVEKYIKRCIESLIIQKYKNIEIILVDDGSTDNSADIIDDFAQFDHRIIVLHKKNQGVSAARNSGIEIASGEYIMFVDGDDWVSDEYISYFLDLVEGFDCEIGMNKNNYSGLKVKSNEQKYVISSEKAIEKIYLGDIFVAVWNKIYKTNLLKQNSIMFNNEIWYGEGMLFNIQCLQYTNKVAIGEKCVYHQTFNPDSAMRSFNINSNLCGIKSLELQKNILKKRTNDIENAWDFHRFCFNKSIIDGLVRTRDILSYKEIYNTCVCDLRKNILIPLKIEKKIKRKILWMGYYISPYIMAKVSAKIFLYAIKKEKAQIV